MCKYSWVHKTYFDQTGLLLIRIIYAMEKKLKCRLYTVTTTMPVEMTENAGGLSVYFKISATMVGQQRNIFNSYF